MIAMNENIARDECPKCRCKEVKKTGNMASYPDHWQNFNCEDCGWLLGTIDNSSYVSCHDFKDFIIEC